MAHYHNKLKESVNFSLKIILRNRTHVLIYNLTILDKYKGRDVANTVESNYIVRAINVTLTDVYAICILLSEFLYNWRDSAARTTPLCPEINNHRLRLSY